MKKIAMKKAMKSILTSEQFEIWKKNKEERTHEKETFRTEEK